MVLLAVTRFRRVTIPRNTHPLVQRLYAEMNAQRCPPALLAERSGVSRAAIKSWRTRHPSSLASLEACFNVLGLEVVVRPQREQKHGPQTGQ